MALIVYLGDEPSAAGYRLAGAEALTPPAGQETAWLVQALARAQVVLLSAATAAQVTPTVLRDAQAALRPLVLVLADLLSGQPPPDLAARLRAQLGFQA